MHKTLVDFIEFYASRHPDEVAFRFLTEKGDETLTYGELKEKAQSIASVIREKIGYGGNALLLYKPSLDFIVAFVACLYAGVSAIPTYPPIPRRLNIDIFRLELISNDSNPKIILADKFSAKLLQMALLKENSLGILNMLFSLGRQRGVDLLLNKIPLLQTDSIPSQRENFVLTNTRAEDIAYLQYSSGSTDNPKGIMVSHDNLLQNIHEIIKTLRITQDSSAVSWLPQYHDLGLIGFMLAFLIARAKVTYLSPFDFLESPLKWFKALSDYKATHTAGPNFSYELIVKEMKKNPIDLNLSCLECAICGAEPVNPKLPDMLVDTFSKYGFKKSMFFPVYGLAENTLMASAGELGRDPIIKNFSTEELRHHKAKESSDQFTSLVSCGHIIDEYCIVDPLSNKVLGDNNVGEIWLRGPSVTLGYWNKPKETAESFYAYTSLRDGPFLRTGDLGFIHDNELYIYGRLKDIILKNGRKFAPQDLELSCQNASPIIRKNNVAAFTVGEKEDLVLVAEVNDSKLKHPELIFNAIKEACQRDFDLELVDIVLIPPKTIPKTTSGKIRRRATRQNYINKKLPSLFQLKDYSAIS